MIGLILIVITGCSYSVYSSGYPHLKTIHIDGFENRTVEYELEEEINNSIADKFDSDGRLRLVDISPDCQLSGEILDYNNKIYGYTESNIEEYEVKILFKISLLDLTNNEVILKTDSLILREEYSSDELFSDFQTEEEAREEIYNDLFDYIIKNSLEKW